MGHGDGNRLLAISGVQIAELNGGMILDPRQDWHERGLVDRGRSAESPDLGTAEHGRDLRNDEDRLQHGGGLAVGAKPTPTRQVGDRLRGESGSGVVAKLSGKR